MALTSELRFFVSLYPSFHCAAHFFPATFITAAQNYPRWGNRIPKRNAESTASSRHRRASVQTRLSSFHFALGAHSCVSYIPSGSSKSFSSGRLSDATLSRSRTSPRRARPYNWISPSAKNSISISLSLLPTTEGFPSPRPHLVSSHVSAPTPADYSAIGEPRNDDAFLHLRHRAISPRFFSLSPSAFQFLSTYERRRNGLDRHGGRRRGRRSYERITPSGVVYSSLSKVKATASLAHTNQSTPRCRGEGAFT